MKTKTGIRAKQRFYEWCVIKGIDLKHFDPEKINFDAPKHKSTLKKKAKEVKDTLNHVFSFKSEPHSNNLLSQYPNIESIVFVPKKA